MEKYDTDLVIHSSGRFKGHCHVVVMHTLQISLWSRSARKMETTRNG